MDLYQVYGIPNLSELKVHFGGFQVGVCPLVLQKLMLCIPSRHGWSESCARKCPRGNEANASSEAQSEALGRSWK